MRVELSSGLLPVRAIPGLGSARSPLLHLYSAMKSQPNPASGCGPPDHSKKKLRPAWRWLPSRRIPSLEPLARKTAAWRPPPRFSENCLDNSLSNYKSMGYAVSLSRTANQTSGQWPPSVAAHSRKKLFGVTEIVRHSVGKSCPTLSSEFGLILETSRLQTRRVVRGSVDRIVGDDGRSFGIWCL